MHVQDALRAEPGQTLAAYLLFQLYAVTGRAPDAREVAAAAASRHAPWTGSFLPNALSRHSLGFGLMFPKP